MGSEVVLDITLGSFLCLTHLGCTVSAFVWRRWRFHKGIHNTVFGWLLLALSAFVGIFLPIGGFTFLDDGQSGTQALIFAAVFCPAILVFSLRALCSCIYIDNGAVIQRIFWRETKVSLQEPGASILLSANFGRLEAAIVSQDGTKVIKFSERGFEGDVLGFIETCKTIQRSNT